LTPEVQAAVTPPRERDLHLYLASSFLENVAAQMLGVAVGWQVYALTHRALDLGYVGLVQLVPGLGLSIPAGHVADRVDRKSVMAASNLALAVCALALLGMSAWGVETVAVVYAVLFFVGAARAFAGPASQAIVPGLVSPERLQSAVTWSSSAWQLATIVGPSLGGVLYGVASGPAWVYAVCAALLGVAAILAAAIRARPEAGERVGVTWESVFAGFRYVRSHRVILESISLDLFAVLLGGATALLPVYASDILHVGPLGLGLLRSAPALGATVTALALAYRPLTRRAGPVMLACVGVFGVATVVFGVSRSFGLSLASLAVLGASDMVSVVVRSTVVQVRTPHDMRGRVSAVNMMFVVGSSELGALESGVTAAWLGAVPAVVVGGLGTLAVVILYGFFSKLRAIDRLDAA
jgi:MFS family permease